MNTVPYLPTVARGAGQDSGRQRDVFDLAALLSMLRRRKAVFLSIALCGLLLTLFIVFSLEKTYTSTAQVLISPPRQNIVNMEAMETPSLPGAAFVDSQVELMRSRAVLQSLIKDQNLLSHALVQDHFVRQDDVSLFSLRYWSQLFGLSDPKPTFAQLPVDVQLAQVTNFLRAGQNIRRIAMTDVVEINYTSTDPQFSAFMANSLVSTFLDGQRDLRLEALGETTGWLDGEIARMRAEVNEADQRVEVYRAANNLVDVEGRSLTDQRRADISRQLVLARTAAAEAEARLGQVEEIVTRGGDVQTIAEVLSSDTISDLRREQAQLTRRRAELLARYGDLHPAVVNVTAEMRDIDAQIESEAERIVANLSNEVAVSSARIRSLLKEQNSLDLQAAKNEEARVQLRELRREANASRQLYETLLEGYKTSFAVSNAVALTPAAQQVSQAQAPLYAGFPNTKLFLAVGVLLSLMVAMGFVLAQEFFDTSVQSLSELEARTGLRPLATIPSLPKNALQPGGLSAYLEENALSRFAESLRKLRSAIEISRIDAPPRLILVSSALPGEGKTLTAIALAQSYIQAGKKTLLVDCDLRRPAVYGRLGLDTPEVGLVDVLTGRRSVADVVQRLQASGLEVLANASIPVDSADLLASVTMQKLLETLKEQYDMVILDAAPVLPIIDSAGLSRSVDAVVLAVHWDETPAPAVRQAVRIFQDHGSYVVGGVLTDVDVNKATRLSSAYDYDESKYAKSYRRYYTT